MLTELRIQNFAIIEDLSLDLREGLITLSGETGAGKPLLVRVPAHRGLLDRYASIEAELSAYQATYAQLMELRRELTSLQAAELDAVRRVELLTFQVQEIEAARLQVDEEQGLKGERPPLAHP